MTRLRSFGHFIAGATLTSALLITGTQAWQVGAAPGETDTTFVPVAPCRLFDTRSGPQNVGDRSAALGPNETFTAQVTGNNGECVGIPNGARAIAFNVTIVDPTAASFLALFPADLTTRPTASNLNWATGQSPTPNKVDVKLSPDGKVKIFNRAGDVDVIADIVGYYTASSLTDLHSRLSAAEAVLATIPADLDSRLNTAEAALAEVPFAIQESLPSINTTKARDKQIGSNGGFEVVLERDFGGGAAELWIVADVFLTAVQFESGADVLCHLTDGTNKTRDNAMRWEASGDDNEDGDEGDASNMSATAFFRASRGVTITVSLRCKTLQDSGDGALIWAPTMLATVYEF